MRMRKALGVGVLVIGTVILGWWGQTQSAHRIENHIREAASLAASGSLHRVTTWVSGRDIHLTGIVDSSEEETALFAALDAVPGRRVIISEVTVLPKQQPFTLDVIKNGPLTAKGFVPTEAARAALALGLENQAAGLTLASGAPAGWLDLAKAGIAALGPLTHGEMHLSDTNLTLTGEALGPDQAAAAEAALAGLPDGTVSKALTLQDDGAPAIFTLDFAAAEGAKIAGKLPKGLDIAMLAATLGLPSIAGDVKTGLLGASADASPFAALKPWLGKVESLQITAGPVARLATVIMQPASDGAGLQAALQAAGFDVSVTTKTPDGANGDMRRNAASGLDQRFMGGYWLDVPKFEAGLTGCQAAADDVLAGARVNFVSGSDELDPSAVTVINDLAPIMAFCAETAGLRAEIGGYTDNSGDPFANLGLSQRRAVAVRLQLVARGVPPASVRAVGHGDADPVADNATEEGRARNRRTKITWSQ